MKKLLESSLIFIFAVTGLLAASEVKVWAAALTANHKLLNNSQAANATYDPNNHANAVYYGDQGWLVVGTGEFAESSHVVTFSSPVPSVTFRLEHAAK
jgi:hypothetical protein